MRWCQPLPKQKRHFPWQPCWLIHKVRPLQHSLVMLQQRQWGSDSPHTTCWGRLATPCILQSTATSTWAQVQHIQLKTTGTTPCCVTFQILRTWRAVHSWRIQITNHWHLHLLKWLILGQRDNSATFQPHLNLLLQYWTCLGKAIWWLMPHLALSSVRACVFHGPRICQ